jgi:DDE superfamily endonuclease
MRIRQACCAWLQVTSEGGMSQLLRRLRIRLKRARTYVHSPDPLYEEKLALIAQVRQQVETAPQRFVLLYLDEMSYYRQPTLASDYAPMARSQPLARWGHGTNPHFRILGALNALTGQVTYCQHSKLAIRRISAFYAELCTIYPQAETIFVVLDNWPIHFHPDLLARLTEQQWPYPFNRPSNWPLLPSSQAIHANLPIQLLCLPTYASWCNPIEKLWRYLRQELLHLHRHTDDWPHLRHLVADFLDQFHQPSPSLLHYVGLLPN